MKKQARSILGVTLLEIMLVLAVAAMIIIMSVRYYESANSSQQANATLQQCRKQ
jgi:type II secretory pathway component PulJ